LGKNLWENIEYGWGEEEYIPIQTHLVYQPSDLFHHPTGDINRK
jgi:hypothetical protein